VRDAVIWVRAQWDRVAGTACVAFGAVILLITFQSVANSRFVADQIATVTSGGLGALFLVAVGVMLRLQADLHDEWRKLDRIEQALRQEPPVETVIHGADHADQPAPRGRILVSAVGLLAAVAVIMIGYQKAANTGSVDTALTGLAVGVAGLGLAAMVVAATVLVSRARLGGRKSRVLAPWLPPGTALPALAGTGPPVAAPATYAVVIDNLCAQARHKASPGRHSEPDAVTLVCIAPGLTRFHRAGCPTLAHATYEEIPREAVPGELRPCQICGAR
jgi:hypothetical protein